MDDNGDGVGDLKGRKQQPIGPNFIFSASAGSRDPEQLNWYHGTIEVGRFDERSVKEDSRENLNSDSSKYSRSMKNELSTSRSVVEKLRSQMSFRDMCLECKTIVSRIVICC